MSEHISHSLKFRFKISEIEYDIRRLEVDLDCSREQSKLLEEALNEKQRRLEVLYPRIRHGRLIGRDEHEAN